MIAALVACRSTLRSVDLPAGTLPGRTTGAPPDLVTLNRDETWRVALARILSHIYWMAALPEPRPTGPRRARCAMLAGDLEALADRFLSGDGKFGYFAEMVFVAAALQVAWTRMAALARCRPARSERCR